VNKVTSFLHFYYMHFETSNSGLACYFINSFTLPVQTVVFCPHVATECLSDSKLFSSNNLEQR
jgi:hypothetical protein